MPETPFDRVAKRGVVMSSTARQRWRAIALASLASMVLISPAACSEPADEAQPLRRINPSPVKAYEVRVTVQDAPGPFVRAVFSAQYDVENAATCGKPNPIAGNMPVIRTVEAVPLTKVSDTEYVATVHTDLVLDQDYYQRGVCRWAFKAGTIGLVGTTDEFGTWFTADLGSAALADGTVQTRYYWKGYYPRAEMTGYSEFGNTDLDKVPNDKRGEFFTIMMAARKPGA
ncbi:hypothetical protein ACBY01_15595 [Sphingomonas sp. ac-8]|uniref:hypothetical protein n=1 Tax=Sphingomonas sp. ac-8 TaxID=3242977 RepID=UPI003A8033F3